MIALTTVQSSAVQAFPVNPGVGLTSALTVPPTIAVPAAPRVICAPSNRRSRTLLAGSESALLVVMSRSVKLCTVAR